jgi:hypothetical protein
VNCFFSLSTITTDIYNTVRVKERDREVCFFGPGWLAGWERFSEEDQSFSTMVCLIYQRAPTGDGIIYVGNEHLA